MADLVTIGVPVYNGARYLRESLESLLAQDHEEIEFIVSDNASSDDSLAIAHSLSLTDRRIRVLGSTANAGAVANFNRCLQEARGRYFMWASDHDLWDARFVSSCLDRLRSQASIVLAYPHTELIDEAGKGLEIMDDHVPVMQEQPLDRYMSLIWGLGWCNMVYGLMRTDDVKAVGGFQNVWAPDHVLLAAMSLRGKISQLDEILYFRRRNRPRESDVDRLARVAGDLDPATAHRRTGTNERDLFRQTRDAHLRLIGRSPHLGRGARLRAWIGTVRCFYSRFGVRPVPWAARSH